jgi:hypothetical protein
VTIVVLSTSIQEIRTDMSGLVQTVKDNRFEVQEALNSLTTMAGSVTALVHTMQHGPP